MWSLVDEKKVNWVHMYQFLGPWSVVDFSVRLPSLKLMYGHPDLVSSVSQDLLTESTTKLVFKNQKQ